MKRVILGIAVMLILLPPHAYGGMGVTGYLSGELHIDFVQWITVSGDPTTTETLVLAPTETWERTEQGLLLKPLPQETGGHSAWFNTPVVPAGKMWLSYQTYLVEVEFEDLEFDPATLRLFVRHSIDGREWSDWQPMPPLERSEAHWQSKRVIASFGRNQEKLQTYVQLCIESRSESESTIRHLRIPIQTLMGGIRP